MSNTPLADEPVTPAAIREAVEWLAQNANGVSLVDWEPRSQTLLKAADEIDHLRAKLKAARNVITDVQNFIHPTTIWRDVDLMQKNIDWFLELTR